jgi:predicted DNA-binding transcriptional regulator AlpA
MAKRIDNLASSGVLALMASDDKLEYPRHTGEWDAFWSAPAAVQSYVRRHLCFASGLAPDDLSALAGYQDVDSWWIDLLQAVDVARDRSSVRASCYDDAVLIQDLVGPDEVCEMLGVKRNTLVVWQRRSSVKFPPALFELSQMPVWARADIEKWALDTGRLELDTGVTF